MNYTSWIGMRLRHATAALNILPNNSRFSRSCIAPCLVWTGATTAAGRLGSSTTRSLRPKPQSIQTFATKSHDDDHKPPSTATTTATEWIPPQHPLAGDKGQSYLYNHVVNAAEVEDRAEEEHLSSHHPPLHERDDIPPAVQSNALTGQEPSSEDGTVDWLTTRRAMLSSGGAAAASLMKPSEAQLIKNAAVDDIPVLDYTLFTRKEIVQILQTMGGQDVQIILDGVGKHSRMGGGSVKGIIIVTGANYRQLKTITETLVRQLRRRKLQDVGVMGAMSGPDGNLNDPHEHWFVVDCHNYIVHIQDTKTRKAINLEGLWSGKDGLHRVDMNDDNAVEDYVAANPVPSDYGSYAYAVGDWDTTLKQLEKNRWTTSSSSSRPVAPPKRLSRKTSGRKT